MRVFVTGAAGFIGANLTRTLLGAGCEIMALVLPHDSLWRLQEVVDEITLVQGNLRDISNFLKTLQKWRPDACIHLAWYVEPGKYLNSSKNIESLMSSLTLLKVLAKVGCRQLVAAGTVAEYKPNERCLEENDPTQPATIYAAAKLLFYHFGKTMSVKLGMNFAWARIFYPYGPFEDERRVVPSLIKSLLNNRSFPASTGNQVRDYIHVEDVASAFWILTEKCANGIYNVSSGFPITIKNLMETIEEIVGNKDLIQYGALPYRDWEPMFLCGNNDQLKGLGWSPKYMLEDGLLQTVDWWRQQVL